MWNVSVWNKGDERSLLVARMQSRRLVFDYVHETEKRHWEGVQWWTFSSVGWCLSIKTYIMRENPNHACPKRPTTIILLKRHLESLPTHDTCNLLTMLNTRKKANSTVMADDVNDLSHSLFLSGGPRVMNLRSHEVDIQSHPLKASPTPHVRPPNISTSKSGLVEILRQPCSSCGQQLVDSSISSQMQNSQDFATWQPPIARKRSNPMWTL